MLVKEQKEEFAMLEDTGRFKDLCLVQSRTHTPREDRKMSIKGPQNNRQAVYQYLLTEGKSIVSRGLASTKAGSRGATSHPPGNWPLFV